MKKILKIFIVSIIFMIIIVSNMQKSYAIVVEKEKFKEAIKKCGGTEYSINTTDDEITVDEKYKINYTLEDIIKFRTNFYLNKNMQKQEVDEELSNIIYLTFPVEAICYLNGIENVNKPRLYFSDFINNNMNLSSLENNIEAYIEELEEKFTDKVIENEIFTLEIKEKDNNEETYNYEAVITIKENPDFTIVQNVVDYTGPSDIYEKAGENAKEYQEKQKEEQEMVNELLQAAGESKNKNETTLKNETAKNNEQVTNVTRLPQTGIDSTTLHLLWSVLGISSIILIGYIVYNRREK